MGLDLVVEGCSKSGHEEEWRRLLEALFAEKGTERDAERFREISIPGYERLGAPRVGFDKAADDWLVEVREAETDEEKAAALKEFHGHYAIELVECDGVPRYSNGGLYEGVDATSFRGAFFHSCTDVLDEATLWEAWESKMPEAAASYGRKLLAAADKAEREDTQAKLKSTFWSKLGLGRPKEPTPIAEQLGIVRAAGRWYMFWGERGHAIRAWS